MRGLSILQTKILFCNINDIITIYYYITLNEKAFIHTCNVYYIVIQLILLPILQNRKIFVIL